MPDNTPTKSTPPSLSPEESARFSWWASEMRMRLDYLLTPDAGVRAMVASIEHELGGELDVLRVEIEGAPHLVLVGYRHVHESELELLKRKHVRPEHPKRSKAPRRA